MNTTTFQQPQLFEQHSVSLEEPLKVPCPTCCGSGAVLSSEALAHMPGMVSKSHPETSRRAAKAPSNAVRFGTQRHKALAAVAMRPMTAAEVAAHINLSRNQTATRLLELHRAGLVKYLVEDGERVTRSTGHNDQGLVHEVTLSGRYALTNAGG